MVNSGVGSGDDDALWVNDEGIGWLGGGGGGGDGGSGDHRLVRINLWLVVGTRISCVCVRMWACACMCTWACACMCVCVCVCGCVFLSH